MAISRISAPLQARLYLDHAATTPVLPQARAAMVEALERWSNPSSPHTDGRAARAALEQARRTIAERLGWRHDVILTSGASEAISIAARQARVPGRAFGATEHDAVRAAFGRARLITVASDGLIDSAALDAALSGPAALVAIQHVNNETGVVQPLAEIAEHIRAAGSLLLADCAQSAGKVPLPDADFIAVSAHKLGGPPGIGALLVRDPALLHAVGGQEKGYRRGTENLPAAAGFAAALENGSYDLRQISRLREALASGIQGAGGLVLPSRSGGLPTIGAYSMPGVTSASQLVQFDLAGISVSAGSACSSGSMKPSRVLQAMGIEEEVAGSAVRVSFGPRTSEADVERFLTEWRRIADRARSRAA